MDDTMDAGVVERGPWPTGTALAVALLPFAFAVGAAVVADRRQSIGPLGPNDILYWIVLPLAAMYPSIAAVARRLAYAPMTVLVVASVVPAFVYATRLLMNPLPKDALGHTMVTPALVASVALPPAVLAAGLFAAIEIASAAFRRGVAVGFFGAIIAALVLAAAVVAPLFAGSILVVR